MPYKRRKMRFSGDGVWAYCASACVELLNVDVSIKTTLYVFTINHYNVDLRV